MVQGLHKAVGDFAARQAALNAALKSALATSAQSESSALSEHAAEPSQDEQVATRSVSKEHDDAGEHESEDEEYY